MNKSYAHLKGKFCVEIESQDQDKVSIKIPLKLAPLGLKMIPKQAFDQVQQAHGIDLHEILDNLDDLAEQTDEDLINITSKDGDKIRIYIKI